MKRVAVPERGAEALFGNHDENLRFLEDTLKVRIRTQGPELLVEGEDAGRGDGLPGLRAARGADEGRLLGVARATCGWPPSS